MCNLLDRFTGEVRNFKVKSEDMIEVMDMFPSIEMKVNKVGETGLWRISACLTNNQWCTLLKECKDKNYKLVIRDTANDMYFENESE